MRDTTPEQSIDKCAGHRSDEIDDKYGVACAKQDKHWGGACTCNGPAAAEYKATDDISRISIGLVLDDDLLAFLVLDVPPFDDLDYDDTGDNSRSDDAEHMETLEPEHFIDPEPGSCFTLIQDEPQQHTNQYIS
mgnify:FL=1